MSEDFASIATFQTITF